MPSVLKDLAEFEGSTYISTRNTDTDRYTYTHPSRTLSVR